MAHTTRPKKAGKKKAPPMKWESPQEATEAVAPPQEYRARAVTGPIEVVLKDGSVFRVTPGPYGKGISVIPMHSGHEVPLARPMTTQNQEPGKRGRKPLAATVALREKLEHDSNLKRGLAAPPEYVRWLQTKDPTVNTPMARTIVYREMKPFK